MSGQGVVAGRLPITTSASVNNHVAQAHTSYGSIASPSQSNSSTDSTAPQPIPATRVREHSLFRIMKKIIFSILSKLHPERPPTTEPLDTLPNAPRPPKEWISVFVKYPFLIGFLAITLAIIISIVTLAVLSEYQSGFVTISTPSGRLAEFIWGRGLLWSSADLGFHFVQAWFRLNRLGVC